MVDYVFSAVLTNAVLATCLAIIAALGSVVWRHPRWSHALWLLVLLKFVTPSFVDLPLPKPLRWSSPSFHRTLVDAEPMRESETSFSMPVSHFVESDEIDAPGQLNPKSIAPQSDDIRTSAAPSVGEWKKVFVTLWVLGAALYLTLAGVRIRRLAQLIHRSQLASAELQSQVTDVAQRLSLAIVPECRITSAQVVPFVFAFGRPVLLLPLLLQTLSGSERESIIAHELAHLRRRDHVVRWLQLIVTALYWWHPVAWLASRRVNQTAELCCDSLVVWRFPQLTQQYGAVLFKAIELFGRQAAPAAVAMTFGEGRFLKRRFKMIVQNRFSYSLPRLVWIAIVLIGVGALPLSLHRLWADESPKPENETTVARAVDKAEKLSDPDVQKRLERVEIMLAELVKQSKQDKSPSKPDPGTGQKEKAAASHEIPLLLDSHDTEAVPEDSEVQAEKTLGTMMREFEGKYELRKTNYNRLKAAQKQVDSVEAAYEAGTVTLDLLLDAQRRLVDAEVVYFRASVELGDPSMSNASKRTLQLLMLKSLKKGRKKALEAWKKVHALYTAGALGGEAEQEAQAREHYFFMKEQYQTVLQEYYRLAGK